MSAPSVTLDNATLIYDRVSLFEDLSMHFSAGSWTTILGQTGIGKSSILRALADLAPLDAGSITTGDTVPLAGRIAYMTQNAGLLPWCSVIENVLLGPTLRGKVTATHREQTHALLAQVGLDHAQQQKPHTLSGGMKQRVALVRTLLEDRPVILMDEPFSALDVATKMHLYQLTRTLLAQRTVIHITHDPMEALRLADHIMVLAGQPAKITYQVTCGDNPLSHYDDLLNALLGDII